MSGVGSEIKKYCVAIIEDNPDIGEVLSYFFGMHGYEVKNYNSVELFLVDSASINIDFLLLDIELSKMNGLDALDLLRKTPKFVNLPIGVMTGHPNLYLQGACIQRGATFYLAKPFDLVSLSETVKHYLKQVP